MYMAMRLNSAQNVEDTILCVVSGGNQLLVTDELVEFEK